MRSPNQMSLPIPEPTLAASPAPGRADHIQPVQCEGYLDLLGLHYSLGPIEGWVEVRRLNIYCPPEHRTIADQAWVDPKTIESLYIQRYEGFARPLSPVSWGFGPVQDLDRHQHVMASFDLAHAAEDFERVDAVVWAQKAERYRVDEMGAPPAPGETPEPAPNAISSA
ncbi:MAG: hypothetical protein HPY55_06625 [Firmicutes bacterium]|nr:hypothetical protein [Bacillota bacterium]